MCRGAGHQLQRGGEEVILLALKAVQCVAAMWRSGAEPSLNSGSCFLSLSNAAKVGMRQRPDLYCSGRVCTTMTKRKFCLYLIKPSHYDDDGYVIQWRLSPIPSNSLASVYGLTRRRHRQPGAGRGLGFRRRHDRRDQYRASTLHGVIDRVKQADVGLVMLIGVQSNQFPRSLDLARPLLAARRAGGDRRVPRLGRHLDAAGRGCRFQDSPADGHLAVCRRIRGAAGRMCCATRSMGR